MPQIPTAIASVGNLAKIGAIAAEDLGAGASAAGRAVAATKAVGKQLAVGAAGGAAAEGVLRPLVEAGLNKGADALGIQHEDVQAPTIGSISQMAAMGALLHNRDSAEFSFAVGLIRRVLEHSGFYLTARGQSGNGYVVAEPEALGDILLRYERKDVDMLCRAVILGSNADLSSLTESQRRRTEAILSRVAQRAAPVSRKLPVGFGEGSEAVEWRGKCDY